MPTKFWRVLGASCVVAGSLVAGSPAQAVTYDFDNSIGASNDFSITSEGQTATFSSSSGPATFTVNPSADLFSFPVALGGFGNFTGNPLTITFSAPVVDRILIPFGIFDAYATAPATLVATTNTGERVEFTTEFDNLISGNPEGVLNFVFTGQISSLTLNSLMVSNSSPAFAIGSVEVPEPMSAALLGGGLITLAVMRRQRSV